MRILIATQNYLQPNNGQATFVRNLARGLVVDGHAVMVATPSDARRSFSRVNAGDSVEVEGLGSIELAPFYRGVFVTPRPAGEVARLLDRFRPDLVHVQDHYPLGRAAARAAHRRALPMVATNHFLPENIVPFVPVLSRFAAARRAMERVMWRQALAVLDLADVITAPSETAAEILRRQGARAPVLAVSNGVDLAALEAPPAEGRDVTRGRFGLAPEASVFLFVGRADREKRLDVLIAAAERLAREGAGEPWQVVMVGAGHDLPALKRQAARAGLGGRVVFTGLVSAGDLRALRHAADVFVMPSEAELQSLATLEAMAAGLPVIAADARALPELVENGESGYLFRAGDAADVARVMARVMAERERWPAMGEAGRRMARRHALPVTVARYEKLYDDTIAARRRAVVGAAGSRAA